VFQVFALRLGQFVKHALEHGARRRSPSFLSLIKGFVDLGRAIVEVSGPPSSCLTCNGSPAFANVTNASKYFDGCCSYIF
jgi:hypothetical protein